MVIFQHHCSDLRPRSVTVAFKLPAQECRTLFFSEYMTTCSPTKRCVSLTSRNCKFSGFTFTFYRINEHNLTFVFLFRQEYKIMRYNFERKCILKFKFTRLYILYIYMHIGYRRVHPSPIPRCFAFRNLIYASFCAGFLLLLFCFVFFLFLL